MKHRDLEIEMLKRDVAHLVEILSIAAHGLQDNGLEASAKQALAIANRYRDAAGNGADLTGANLYSADLTGAADYDEAGNGDPGQDVDPEPFDTSVL